MGDKDGRRGETHVTSAVRGGGGTVLRLRAVSGPGVGRALAMARAQATLGRHATNDLCLNDPEVSGVHAELYRDGLLLRVRDLQSTNGTWLGPHRIDEARLAPGAELRVGTTVLRVELDEGATASPPEQRASFGGMVGASPAMRELFATLERIAPKPLSVLVQGETGTGKEEVARALHERSTRARGPFVVIDATALPESLVEGLLFGHERGAFTGADQRRPGLFETADGGTVFLDELGELPLPAQAKFLRVLERQEFTRVGGTAPIKVDVRVVAATNRDLRNEIEAGRFREDLFYRLAQVHVRLPPLRARAEDVPLIAERILATAVPGRTMTLDVDARAYLAAQPWPGNVRELRNVLLRAAALASTDVIRRADVAGEGLGFRGMPEERAPLDVIGTFAVAKERAMERFEATYLAALMKRTGGNLTRAAREADLARHHLRDRLKRRGLYGVDWSDDGDGEG